ncbi:MAG: histidine phosphatase family protein [Clostridiales bacterium]|nr:histidine phosphatase family protein [Clostridiales bacterium]
MKIVFIRHGEPDMAIADERGFIGQGRNFAPLTDLGRRQAAQAADSPLLTGCQLIVASPYTRALQTAAIISRKTGLDLLVETDLHEFIPDKTFQQRGEEEDRALHRDFMLCRGEYPPGESRKWETIAEIIARTKPVLDRYAAQGYEKIAVVAHGGVIRRYTGVGFIAHGEVSEIGYTPDFVPFGWV